MTTREALQELLQEFGKHMDVAQLKLDEDDCCPLTLAGDLRIFLQFREASGDLLLAGIVGRLPAEEDEQADAMRFLLISNLYGVDTDGGTLSLEPENNVVMLHKVWDPQTADVAGLARTLEAFADLLECWKHRYGEMLEEDDDGASPFGQKTGEDETTSAQVDPTLLA